MADEPQATWTRLSDAPEGEMLEERFTNYLKPLKDAEEARLNPSIIEMAPGERGPYHYHEGTVQEYYVVLDGELRVELADETPTATEGAVFFFPPEVAHRPFNDGSESVRLLSLRVGEGGRTVLDS